MSKSFRCEMCDKTFETPQALSSHVTYIHRRGRPVEGPDTPLPPHIQNDPEIIALRKKLEKKRLEKALEDLGETPKITDLAERVTRLEEAIKDIDTLRANEKDQDKTLRSIADWMNYLKNDNERHKSLISRAVLFLGMNSGDKDLVKALLIEIREKYGLYFTDQFELRKIGKQQK